MIVDAIQTQIISGTKTYPIYIAFMPASDILAVSEVPSFGQSTPHDTIATNVLTPPIREWQRPLDQMRVDGISQTFDNTGELMPNPVLLAENVAGNSPPVTVAAKMVGGLQSGLVEVTLQPPTQAQKKPLWVLDGQHRIHGMAASAQSTNLVPVVLLLNHGGGYYNGPVLAKLFAQVTTTAYKLDDLHNEWLTFAFKLGRYSPNLSNSTYQSLAMEVVATLCKTPLFGTTVNPFLNRIRFNSHMALQSPAPGGFAYTCIELQKLIYETYYNLPITGAGIAHLQPQALAEQIVLAHAALSPVVQSASNSVFFGPTPGSGQKIMQDAFLAGVFSYLRRHGSATSWPNELSTLQFGATNWNFNWIKSLNGAAGSTSRELAIRVLSYCFGNRTLPPGGGNIADFLKGNGACIKVEFSHLGVTGRVLPAKKMIQVLLRGSVTSHSIAPRKHVRIRQDSLNIGKLTVTDKQSPPGSLVTYANIRNGGMKLGSMHGNPLSLLVTMEHYGENSSTADLDVSW